MLRLILNPNSGTPAMRRRILKLATRACERLGAGAAELRLTERAGHAGELAAEAQRLGYSRVVLFGGDGTVNEVASVLAGSTLGLGIVPCGSGNGLARHFRLPMDPEAALALAIDPTARESLMDVGVGAASCFVNVLGLGFDAALAKSFSQSKRRGLLVYVSRGLRLWLAFRPVRLGIRTPDRPWLEKDCLVLALANSNQYGNDFSLAPWARTDDGLLEAVMVLPGNPLQLGLDLIRLRRGKMQDSTRIRMLRGASFEIKASPGTLFHVDGELRQSETGMLQVGVKPQALRVVIGNRRG